MLRKFELQAELGVLRVGLNTAAHLLNIHVTRVDDTLNNLVSTVQARVARVDQFWITQRPLQLAVDMNGHWWCWRNVTIPGPGELQLGPTTFTVVGDPVVVSNLQLL